MIFSIGATLGCTTNQNLPFSDMEISSPAFGHNQTIPSLYTCDGKNINPPLEFKNIPESAVSLALICDDPDAPGGTWVHWTVWNILPDTTTVSENSAPDGIEGTTSWNRTGYGGPCPPSGTHRYFFKLYALNKFLGLSPLSKKEDLETAMAGSIIGQAELIGLYQRQ